jgi:hypothetical protein
MKLLEFNKMDGFPVSTSTFKFMQEQMLQLQMLSLLGGTNYVVSGCSVTGTTLSDGLVVIAGEVLPFVGGTPTLWVTIIETATTRSFQDTTLNTYYKNRVAQFSSVATDILWSTFEVNNPSNAALKRLRLAEALLAGLRTDLNALSASFAGYTPTWASITGKPSALVTYAASVHLGDIALGDNNVVLYHDSSLYTIIIPDQLTGNYVVVGNMSGIPVGGDDHSNATVFWNVFNKSGTSFQLYVIENWATAQNIYFDFAIIKL